MKFNKTLYHFQNDVLKKFESEIDRGDKKIHIVAPPGSGKTIMWLEMISRINWNCLILVPNITLQDQWKDKIEKHFLEKHENIEELVSLSTSEIKKINIITYQALTQTWETDDIIMNKILNNWYDDIKENFTNYKEFEFYLDDLKEENQKLFLKTLSKYKKKQKKLNNVESLLSQKVWKYFEQLKEFGIDVIVLDEAHHLTNWWSTVTYYLWNKLWKIFIIWLTATPPFENTDFFILDDDYSYLLWEVDYYIPQPAVVKSWKLAPYQDLVYFVEPADKLQKTLQKFEDILIEFLEKNKTDISEIIYSYLQNNFQKLLKEKWQKLTHYIKYLYNYSDKNLADYMIWDDIGSKINIEDLAKTIWKYVSIKSISNKKDYAEVKKIFFNLGYIWRGSNFYKFRTPIDMQLIYSKSKIDWVEKILDAEIQTQGENMKCAIITDFLDENEHNYLNCKYILKSLAHKYKKYNPILVSWQWNYRLSDSWELIELSKNLIEITQDLSNGDINILIGTRWILWEWWDCPELNTLIDLTWITAYMSVNQVRWRAIRLDLKNSKKTSNIYDIVCLWKWIKWNVDMKRLIVKHDRFYGIDDSWLIIKWVNHIYPEISIHYMEYERINQNMLLRIPLRNYIYDLWKIDGKFSNKEIFWLNLHIENYWKILPLCYLNSIKKSWITSFFSHQKYGLESIWKNNFYSNFFLGYLKELIEAYTQTLKDNKIIPKNFSYKILSTQGNDIKIVSYYQDDIVIKSFITYISKIFSIITNHKYVLDMNFVIYNWEKLETKKYSFWLWDELCKNKYYRENLRINLNKMRQKYLIKLFNIIPNLCVNFIELLFYHKAFNKNLQYDMIVKSSNKIEIKYLRWNSVYKKEYIGRKPFITAKIEKLWI